METRIVREGIPSTQDPVHLFEVLNKIRPWSENRELRKATALTDLSVDLLASSNTFSLAVAHQASLEQCRRLWSSELHRSCVE